MKPTRIALVLALAVVAVSVAAEGQQPGRIYRIGILRPGSLASPYGDALQNALRAIGYTEGRNAVFEQRWTEGKAERLPDLAAELVRLKVDVIVAVSTPAALAAKRASASIPIVITYIGDPVAAGLVASLRRPGGNVTGLSALNVEYSGKWLELLREAVPNLAHAAVLSFPPNPNHALIWRKLQVAAQTLGVTLHPIEVRDAGDFEAAFAAMVQRRVGGLIVLPDPLFTRHAVADLATRHRIPAIYQWRDFAEAGGLMAYGPSLVGIAEHTAVYVDKILKGAKPADLPVEQPTKFELVINLKTAKGLGLTISPSLLSRMDHGIE
jgi:putative ABC transport system substrate-binding protein